MVKLSIVTPFFNEAECLPHFRRRVFDAVAPIGVELELVLVDDHSSDGSSRLARQWAESDPRVVYVRLSRNCGSHAACTAGLSRCTGDAAVVMAADLQDPPEFIVRLVECWRDGVDVVWAVRERREGETQGTRFFAACYYRLMRRLALPNMPQEGADFVLLGRKVIDAYNSIREKHTSFLAVILWLGFRQTFVRYVKESRHAGTSKWTFGKKVKILIDSVVSFSYVPIRLMSLLGVSMAMCGIIYAGVVIVGRMLGWVAAGTGFAALMTVLLFGQGMTLTMLGVLGEYLWRTFNEARGRPAYVVEEFVSRMNRVDDGNDADYRSDRADSECFANLVHEKAHDVRS